MKTVVWFLLGCRTLALVGGMAIALAGCGENAQVTGGVTAEDEVKKMETTRNAMEAASKKPQR